MKFKFLFACSFVFTCSVLQSATIGATIGGSTDALLFETAGGDPLIGGTLSIGAFDGTPSIGLGFADIGANFIAFGSASSPSGAFGNFSSGSFIDNVIPSDGSFDFRGSQIYALVVNSDQTEFAFFTADGLDNWIFPDFDDAGINPGSDETDVILNQQNNIFAGVNDTLDPDGGGGAGTFPSLQLVAIPEPSSAMLLAISSLALLRKRSRK